MNLEKLKTLNRNWAKVYKEGMTLADTLTLIDKLGNFPIQVTDHQPEEKGRVNK